MLHSLSGRYYMINKKSRAEIREKRHWRLRHKIAGTGACPRLAVYRSNKHIYAQIIDDDKRVTIASASTKEKDFALDKTSNVDAAKVVGKTVADRAKAKGISKVIFDRGGYIYHGKVAAVADAAREAGLVF
jgi:large subunit ribosomal protein L18